jgi:hypothetical protein
VEWRGKSRFVVNSVMACRTQRQLATPQPLNDSLIIIAEIVTISKLLLSIAIFLQRGIKIFIAIDLSTKRDLFFPSFFSPASATGA